MTTRVSGLRWDRGTWGKRGLQQYTLRSHCYVGEKVFDFMTCCLGYVREKADGRWEWFLRVHEFHPHWKVARPLQGVRSSLEAAKAKVEENLG